MIEVWIQRPMREHKLAWLAMCVLAGGALTAGWIWPAWDRMPEMDARVSDLLRRGAAVQQLRQRIPPADSVYQHLALYTGSGADKTDMARQLNEDVRALLARHKIATDHMTAASSGPEPRLRLRFTDAPEKIQAFLYGVQSLPYYVAVDSCRLAVTPGQEHLKADCTVVRPDIP